MGKLNIKLSNNYIWDPEDAANDYSSLNKTTTIVVPSDIKGLSVIPNLDLQRAFGAYGELPNGTYWAFVVCYLFNQQAGITGQWDKTQDALFNNGEITQGVREIQSKAGIREISNADIINQLFVDAGKKAGEKLNKLVLNSDQDWEIDFNVQFNPSDVLGHDYKYTYSAGSSPYKNYQDGQTETAGKHSQNDKVYDDFLYQGAYGDKRAWMHGSGISFYSTNFTILNNVEEVDKWSNEQINQCDAEQSQQWDQQWSEMEALAETIAEAKAAAEAQARSGGAPSIPSDAFNIDESGDASKWWPAYIKYQDDNRPEASDIRKALNDGLELDGTASIIDYYNADEDENERYAVIGNTVLNEPLAMKGAKIIQDVFMEGMA